ncbi:hypothetical protein [Bradyrhizobium sp. CCBAU 51753]|uniref:hypothetical protein n=1 Tax=Bradyrhizobium sp. CCBAU 51753 TaxID=1325100 RepID=UPI00188ABCD2|nr:hypothetical protein [Bradyrhizobium sp. CCBAU 51753]
MRYGAPQARRPPPWLLAFGSFVDLNVVCKAQFKQIEAPSRLEPIVRELVVDAIRETGFDVVQAANGEEALSSWERRSADALLTHVARPEKMDGGRSQSTAESMIRVYL